MQLSFLYKKKYSWRDMGISTVTAILAQRSFWPSACTMVHSISRDHRGAGGTGRNPCCWSIGFISRSISNFVMNAICFT